MNSSDPKVIEKFKSLPQKLKDALFSEDTTEAVFAIGKENNLTVYQMGELADETGLIILGLTRPEEYAKNLAQKLGTDPATTNKIVQAVNQKVFDSILEELKALHRGESVPTTEKTATPSPLPAASTNIEAQVKSIQPAVAPNKPTVESIKPISGFPLPARQLAGGLTKEGGSVHPPTGGGGGGGVSAGTIERTGKDPYRESLDEEIIASPFAKTPIMPPQPAKPISPPPPAPSTNLPVAVPPTPRPLVVTPPSSVAKAMEDKPKPMSWEEVMAHPETKTTPAAGSGKDAKVALEKMLNPTQSQSGADPYRESLE